MLPSLARLRLGAATSAPSPSRPRTCPDQRNALLSNLPLELAIQVALYDVALDEDPCGRLEALCAVNRELGELCRTELYDAANVALGWYGTGNRTLADLRRLLDEVRSIPPEDDILENIEFEDGPPPLTWSERLERLKTTIYTFPPQATLTPKTWFVYVCSVVRRWKDIVRFSGIQYYGREDDDGPYPTRADLWVVELSEGPPHTKLWRYIDDVDDSLKHRVEWALEDGRCKYTTPKMLEDLETLDEERGEPIDVASLSAPAHAVHVLRAVSAFLKTMDHVTPKAEDKARLVGFFEELMRIYDKVLNGRDGADEYVFWKDSLRDTMEKMLELLPQLDAYERAIYGSYGYFRLKGTEPTPWELQGEEDESDDPDA